MPSQVEPKTLQELQAMHTGSLMKRREALLRCEKSFSVSDLPSRPEDGLIRFKDTPEWQQAYADLKAVLATREHVPNKAERKALRQQKAKKRRP